MVYLDDIYKQTKDKFEEEKVFEDYQSISLSGLYLLEEKFLNICGFNEYKGMDILIPGCGTGREVLYFYKKDANVIGYDISKKMVDECNRNINRQLCIEWDSRGYFPINEKFDLIFASNCFIEHIPSKIERQHLLREFHNILKPGAKIILSVHNREFLGSSHKQEWINQEKKLKQSVVKKNGYTIELGDKFVSRISPKDTSDAEMFFHIYSESEIINDLEATGFMVEKLLSVENISGYEMQKLNRDVIFISGCK